MRKPVSRVGRGFTIVELMIVVAVIGILASIAIPGFMRYSARAYRAEMLNTVVNIERYLKAVHDNTGTFLPEGASAGFQSALNPGTAVPVGQPGTWDPNASGWADFPYPPDGALRMRYWYKVNNADEVLISVCGSLPGLGADSTTCLAPTMGNYRFEETLFASGSSSPPNEIPEF